MGVWTIVISLVLAVGIPLILCYGCFLLVRAFCNLPNALRWHCMTALIWTAITVIQTALLILQTDNNHFTAYIALMVAGTGMIPSWVQFIERRSGETFAQRKRSWVARLCVQTLFGPAFLWVALIGIDIAGQWAFESAMARQNLPLAFFLQKNKMATADNRTISADFEKAILRRDPDAVMAYLAVGATVGDYDGFSCYNNSYYHKGSLYDALQLSVPQEDSRITELLLRYKDSHKEELLGYGDPLLLQAVELNKPNQVRTLLRYGAEKKVYNEDGKSALQIARDRGYKEIVALLVQTGQEKAYLK